MDPDQFFMLEALKEAHVAFEKNEVPIGAVLVYKGEVIARAHNLVETLKKATAHAEILCLEKGANVLGDWRLLDTTLYVTLEPCAMCYGAIVLSRVKRLVYAAPDIRQGALGSWVDLGKEKHPIHTVAIKSGVYQDEAGDLLKRFFQKRRVENECCASRKSSGSF